MPHNMKQLTEAGRKMLQKDLQRDFDETDLIQMLQEEDRTEAIIAALQAGYALGYQYGTQDTQPH